MSMVWKLLESYVTTMSSDATDALTEHMGRIGGVWNKAGLGQLDSKELYQVMQEAAAASITYTAKAYVAGRQLMLDIAADAGAPPNPGNPTPNP
jgi:hypothetical protein